MKHLKSHILFYTLRFIFLLTSFAKKLYDKTIKTEKPSYLKLKKTK